jgi:hypothetical protein
MGILVIDVGTSSVRAAIVRSDTTVQHIHRRPLPPDVPMPGLVEFDPAKMARAVLEVARASLSDAGGRVDAVGVTAQRSSAIAWDARSGEPLGPGLGWQDLRTVGTCLELQGEGIHFSPSESATKFAWLLEQLDPDQPRARQARDRRQLDRVAAERRSSAHHRPQQRRHHRSLSPATAGRLAPGRPRPSRLSLPGLPCRRGLVRPLGEASALPGSPPLCALVGDQQASLMGQGCTRPGLAKATFGTGGMLDVCLGATRARFTPPEATTVAFPSSPGSATARSRGERSDHAGRGHRGRLAGRGPRAHLQRVGVRGGGCRMRRHRRGGRGAGPARLRNPPVGFRSSGRHLRPHPGIRGGAGGARRARRRGPLWSRSSRIGRTDAGLHIGTCVSMGG